MPKCLSFFFSFLNFSFWYFCDFWYLDSWEMVKTLFHFIIFQSSYSNFFKGFAIRWLTKLKKNKDLLRFYIIVLIELFKFSINISVPIVSTFLSDLFYFIYNQPTRCSRGCSINSLFIHSFFHCLTDWLSHHFPPNLQNIIFPKPL